MTVSLIRGYLTSAECAVLLLCRAFLSPAWVGVPMHTQSAWWPLSELNALEAGVFRAGGICCVVPAPGLERETTLGFLATQTGLEFTM